MLSLFSCMLEPAFTVSKMKTFIWQCAPSTSTLSIFIYALSASLDALLTHHISAAKIGMRFLKAGSTAVEAVEAAIRVLEDNEITNAGYGSNLSVDGHVECDASIVDQYGRSGAVGAMGRE
jgi:taspase, threonine aspartase, 1